MTQRGGARPGAGRKKGSLTEAKKIGREVSSRVTKKLADASATPLDIMARVMQGDVSITEMQFEAAKAAAPYIHPKLSAIQMDARVRRSVEDMTDEELAALASGEEGGGEGQD
ncbi:hypothetical protein [Komagataeibacter sp. FNDCF1]|uniref:hypothetical protein n=1 Tax=Komagataeibacter sp. FNDCF1 TaxID=2878681 RepID=UPI001E59CFD2|nr:hypothetical protein [Komagataeibacter sp. FNDCF1]MCE2563366.1 hypothetical protein [Komagataeibacter sp. FNDCF1]